MKIYCIILSYFSPHNTYCNRIDSAAMITGWTVGNLNWDMTRLSVSPCGKMATPLMFMTKPLSSQVLAVVPGGAHPHQVEECHPAVFVLDCFGVMDVLMSYNMISYDWYWQCDACCRLTNLLVWAEKSLLTIPIVKICLLRVCPYMVSTISNI